MDLEDLEIDLGTVTDSDNVDEDTLDNNSIIIDQTDGQVCFGELIEPDSVSCIGYPNGWTWINSLTGHWILDKSPVIVALEKLRGNHIIISTLISNKLKRLHCDFKNVYQA